MFQVILDGGILERDVLAVTPGGAGLPCSSAHAVPSPHTLQPLIPVPTHKAGVLKLMGATASGDSKKMKLFLTSEAPFSKPSTLAWVE